MPTIAAIDVGSNAIRLAIANVTTDGGYQMLCNVREPVRLGQDVFTKGSISTHTIDRTLQTFIDFKQKLDEQAVTHVRAIGTSALREAMNRDSLLKSVAKASGIDISIIGGEEEARLIHVAVKQKVNLKNKVAMLVDIGGGSVEVVLADDMTVLCTESYSMGSVRLLKILDEKAGEERFHQLVTEYVDATQRRLKQEIGNQKIDICVGTGGSIEALGELRKDLFVKNSNQKITADELKALVKKLRGMTFEQRIQDLRLRPDRADVIVPAAIVLQKIVQEAGVDEVAIPGIGLKDGVLLEIVAELRDHEKRSYRGQVIESARRLGRKYYFDEKHGVTVAKLAVQIFDQTKSFHGLDDEARLILEVAALLHDIGHYVNVANHHKHTFYLIQSSPLVGLTTLQMALVANVARYHRKSPPKLQHKPYEDLAPKQRLIISQLASILRLADALDHEHASTVDSVEVEYKRPRFLFRLKGKGDMLLEKWALAAKRDFFESVFDANVVVEDLAT
ncbi:MAG TPA: Ppx/GppA phosphatase family protein [Terriglobia bacterium]|nr:Ppx/GppA phosphatase family protein [Terriglobia bacterium]